MKLRTIKNGFTLTETLVVVGIIALLLSVGIPAANKLNESVESGAGVRSVINAALCNARATAIKEQKYAGVRFQFGKDGRQYMVVVVYDDNVGNWFFPAIGLRAVERRKPNALPKSVGVMDLMVKNYYFPPTSSVGDVLSKEKQVLSDADIVPTGTGDIKFVDATTFTILFSPSGKLVHHAMRVSYDSQSGLGLGSDVFNIASSGSLFTHDDKSVIDDGYQIEYSRKSFVIYNIEAFGKTDPMLRWSGYLSDLYLTGRVFVNPHSGEIVNR